MIGAGPSAGTGRHRLGRVLAPAIIAVGLFCTGPMHAGFVSATSSSGQIATFSVDAPSPSSGSLLLVVGPPLRCQVTLTWTASTQPGSVTYEVERRVVATGSTDGSWTVSQNTFVDSVLVDPVAFDWRVRTAIGSWRSAWISVPIDDPLLCDVLP